MPQEPSLASRVRSRYPGAYESLSDAELEQAVVSKYPQYERLVAPPATESPSLMGRVADRFGELRDFTGDVLTGAAKGLGQTATNAVDLGLQAMRVAGGGRPLAAPATNLDPVREWIGQPENATQRGGYVAEQVGEFMVPMGLGARAAGLASRPGLIRGGLRMAGEGLEQGAKAFVQSGGDPSETASAAATGAAAVPVVGAIRGAARAVGQRLPERLFSRTFVNESDDVAQRVASEARGQAINPTLAREALDRGARGSLHGMAVQSVKSLDGLESQLQTAIQGRQVPLDPRMRGAVVNLLRGIEKKFGGSVFAERADEAARLAQELSGGGSALVAGAQRSAPAETVLQAKRFLDNMRNTSSFRLDPQLSAQQEHLKGAADLLRRSLHQFDDISGLLNEERIAIEMRDDLVKAIVRSNNKQLINTLDFLMVTGSSMAGVPFGGLGLLAGLRASTVPSVQTNVGVGLDRAYRAIPGGIPESAGRAASGLAGGAGRLRGQRVPVDDDDDDEE